MSVERQINLVQWNAIDYLIITLWLLTNVASVYKLTSVLLISHRRVLFEFH